MRDGFGQFCPVAMASEVFAVRWTPIILRELLAGSHRFNEIHRCIPLISRALLARRLRDLEAAGILTVQSSGQHHGREYHLTPAGLELRAAIDALGTWGQRWTARVQPHKLDAGLLMWNVRRRIDTARLPARRVVAEVSFVGVPAGHRGATVYWLLLQRSGVELCLSDPGFEVDLLVAADLAALTRVWLGDLTLTDALRQRKVRLSGPAALVRQFPTWLMLSRFAHVPRPSPAERDAA